MAVVFSFDARFIIKTEQATNLLRNVTIINFNYDRTIEHFLFNRLQTNLGLDREEAGQALGALTANMIRPYGSVGPLPWQQDQGPVRLFSQSGSREAICTV